MQSASPCERRTRSPKATTMVGSASRSTPLASSIASPTRKSRLPAMKPTVFVAAASRSTSTQRASKPRSAMSSPTQTSNRSPRMKTASASVWRRCAAQASNATRRVLGEVKVGEQVDRAPGLAARRTSRGDAARGSGGRRGDDAATAAGGGLAPGRVRRRRSRA